MIKHSLHLFLLIKSSSCSLLSDQAEENNHGTTGLWTLKPIFSGTSEKFSCWYNSRYPYQRCYTKCV